ncbi:MAG: hypothetical protein JXA93_00345 [Anaerolineae bacterium]|nr:hypothetical protein [Anaerolineae bacterium]
MKRRIFSGGLAITLVLAILSSTGAGSGLFPTLQAARPMQAAPIPDLDSLLDYPHSVQIEDLSGADAELAVVEVLARPEAVLLRMALAEGGQIVDRNGAVAMRVTLDDGAGTMRIVDMVVVPVVAGKITLLPLIVKQYTGAMAHLAPPEWHESIGGQYPAAVSRVYFVGMVADDGTGFFQVHKTNLDPALAAVPYDPIVVNNMPYFYITTLHVVAGRIVYWHYWWYDSHHHPNWYYAYYLHYWDYYFYRGYNWTWWYHWVYGWYYWRFWYYWSSWFPW